MIDYLGQKQQQHQPQLQYQTQMQLVSSSNSNNGNHFQQHLSPELQMIVQPSQTSNYGVKSGQRFVSTINQAQQQTGNELIGYYFGSISRETAEWILKNHANQMDGAYLLRSSGPNDDFVLSLMVNHTIQQQSAGQSQMLSENQVPNSNLEVLHYKIVETEDSFVALHGQLGDEKFATIDELIEKSQGVATKPRWPILRQSLESQILPPTYWGLTVDQVRLAILIKAKQWGFPMLSSLFQQEHRSNNVCGHQKQQANGSTGCNNDASSQIENDANATTLNNETIRTLIYKSLHEFQPWFHGRITREEAERRIGEGNIRDGRFLVRERDNYSYAMCISHKRTTKHYRIDVLPTGELAIQDGHKFTSLMALVSHYTIMSDGLWCALTQACPRPINNGNYSCSGGLDSSQQSLKKNGINQQQIRLQPSTDNVCIPSFNGGTISTNQQNVYCVPPICSLDRGSLRGSSMLPEPLNNSSGNDNLKNFHHLGQQIIANQQIPITNDRHQPSSEFIPTTRSLSHSNNLICAHQGGVASLKAPIREWLQTINHKWSQLMASKNQHQSLNSFLFGSQNPLNNHCRHSNRENRHHRHRKCKNGHTSCGCIQQIAGNRTTTLGSRELRIIPGQQQVISRSNELDADNRVMPNLNRCRNVAATRSFYDGNKGASNCGLSASHCSSIRQEQRSTNAQVSTVNYNGMSDNPVVHEHGHASLYPDDQSRPPLQQATVANSSMTSQLLSHLPQNSGFALNSQSFIGSPLFAVRTMAQLDRNQSLVGSYPSDARNISGEESTSSDGGGNVNHTEVEKLISPAHSIASNVNLIQGPNSSACNNNNSMDIYGSQTSTALVNDQAPTTSSSSSSGTHLVTIPQSQLLRQSLGNSISRMHNSHQPNAMNITPESEISQTTLAHPVPLHGGTILCGQHAGPAFRYTNCSNDEIAYKQCSHRPPLSCGWSVDDSQLAHSGTKLTCPAAMAKFVQFQDGQCLRTHRDTRSIQMAYLSSRPVNNGSMQVPRLNQSRQSDCNKMPLSELNGFKSPQAGQLHNNQPALIGNDRTMRFQVASDRQQKPQQEQSYICSKIDSVSKSVHQSDLNFLKVDSTSYDQQMHLQRRQKIMNLNQNNNDKSSFGQENQAKGSIELSCDEIDLMDCNEVVDDHCEPFSYDPKLIKSSSIETLCGIGKNDSDDETELDNLIANCKSNTELMMSLLPCWINGNASAASAGILNPIVTAKDGNYTSKDDRKQQEDQQVFSGGIIENAPEGSSMLSTLICSDLGKNNQLESMKKKHDLDELTTALLAGLTANLKESVDLKNKRSGFSDCSGTCNNNNNISNNLKNSDKINNQSQRGATTCLVNEDSVDPKIWTSERQLEPNDVNRWDLISEFDTLVARNGNPKSDSDGNMG